MHRVLIEGFSKRSADHFQGRTSSNKVVIFPKKEHLKGSYVTVAIHSATSATLLGEVTGRMKMAVTS